MRAIWVKAGVASAWITAALALGSPARGQEGAVGAGLGAGVSPGEPEQAAPAGMQTTVMAEPSPELPTAPAELPAPPAEPPQGEPAGYGRQAAFLRDLRLDGHVGTTWEGAFGVGARLDWLLIAGTFRYSARDELALSVGADVTFIEFSGSQLVEAFPTAVLQWSIGLNDRTFLYPEFGLLGHIERGEWNGLYPNIGFGGRYYLYRSVGLQARFGWPMALTLGAVF